MKNRPIAILATLFAIGSIGCASNPVQTTEYIRCNETSLGNMAEIESGFFYVCNEILYYADKEDLNKWVAVCNKVNCNHDGSSCHAYVNGELAQKEDNLYYFANNDFSIREISKDGSGAKDVFEVPVESKNSIENYRGMISSDSFMIYYQYLREDGMYQQNIAHLDEKEQLYHVFSETSEDFVSQFTVPASIFYAVRGEDVIISSLLTQPEEVIQNVLWKMDGDVPQRVNLSEEVSILYSYLSEEAFSYYKTGEGFYRVDLKTGEETLLSECTSDDGRGYVLTEECMVECNRYMDYKPEEAYLRIYEKEQWWNVELPKEIAQLECAFYPVSVASDRIFFIQDDNGSDGYGSQLYYVLLGEETMEIKHCYTFGNDSYFELSEETSTEEIEEGVQKVDIPVVDTDDYFIKVTGYTAESKYNDVVCEIRMYCENRTDEDCGFTLQNFSINGIGFTLGAGISLKANESKEHVVYITQSHMDYYGISERYDVSEYTDIAFAIQGRENTIQEIVHFYPYGEELAQTYVREEQETDQVLIDNEYIKATIVEYKDYDAKNDCTVLYVVNKTDKIILFGETEMPTINGKGTENVRCVLFGTHILPNGTFFYPLKIRQLFLEELDIDMVETFEVILTARYNDYTIDSSTTEKLVNEKFVITPQ